MNRLCDLNGRGDRELTQPPPDRRLAINTDLARLPQRPDDTLR
jgi:hypothetical protein